jgi:Ca-activated chloride channel family protein
MSTRAALVSLLLLAPSCGGVGGSSIGEDFGDDGFGDGGGGDLGATPGGAQDIAYAREQIAMGQVPVAEVISVEGLLSEHDLPTIGDPCEAPLCTRPAIGVAPSIETGQRSYWLHLGMTSGLGADFQRPPLDLVVAIDTSSSMSVDMTETTEAVARLIGKLRQDDRIAVFAFDDDIRDLHELGPVTDADALVAKVRALRADGGWNIDAAAQHAFAIAGASPADDRLERVMMLSCGYPAVSADGSDPFSALVMQHARNLVGLSFFGVLLGYDGGLGDLLGKARGGSYYYLDSLERTVEVFDRDFDLMVTPLAYDLRMALDVGDGFRVERIYGVPGDDAGQPRLELDVATAFLSRRRGGIVARLSRLEPDSEAVGAVDLSYSPEPAMGWSQAETQSAPIAAPWGDDGSHYQSSGVRKAALLVNQAEGMIAACADYHAGDIAGARAQLEQLLQLMRPEAEDLAEDAIAAEVALVEKLLANMSAGG